MPCGNDNLQRHNLTVQFLSAQPTPTEAEVDGATPRCDLYVIALAALEIAPEKVQPPAFSSLLNVFC